MTKEFTIAIVILVVVFLVIGFFAIVGNFKANSNTSNSDSRDIISNVEDKIVNSNNQNNINNINDNSLENPCEQAKQSYACFQYQSLNQENGNGIDERPEQIRQEPCQPLPKKCEVCFDSPEQIKGSGSSDILEQVRKNC